MNVFQCVYVRCVHAECSLVIRFIDNHVAVMESV